MVLETGKHRIVLLNKHSNQLDNKVGFIKVMDFIWRQGYYFRHREEWKSSPPVNDRSMSPWILKKKKIIKMSNENYLVSIRRNFFIKPETGIYKSSVKVFNARRFL